jgi:hypothetical protein
MQIAGEHMWRDPRGSVSGSRWPPSGLGRGLGGGALARRCELALRGGGYEAPDRFSEVCRPWAPAVDAIFASHTLGRCIGRVEGTPVVQP